MEIGIICLIIYCILILIHATILFFTTEDMNFFNLWIVLYLILTPFTLGTTCSSLIMDRYKVSQALSNLSFYAEDGKKVKWASPADYASFIEVLAQEDPSILTMTLEDPKDYVDLINRNIENGNLIKVEKRSCYVLYFNPEN